MHTFSRGTGAGGCVPSSTLVNGGPCADKKLEDGRVLLACAIQQESKLHLAPRIEGGHVLSDRTVRPEGVDAPHGIKLNRRRQGRHVRHVTPSGGTCLFTAFVVVHGAVNPFYGRVRTASSTCAGSIPNPSQPECAQSGPPVFQALRRLRAHTERRGHGPLDFCAGLSSEFVFSAGVRL